ncbi:hypothetical protein [Nitrospina watsonii]|uniref:hypothetical protein n=1 Tax=Nitrospina watsonii TaxID=1323948 RepID=UPI0024913017|nr:hypothetical protein [Nitrospina watsonii]
MFFAVLVAFFFLEVTTHLSEKAIGYYLKWENHNRPQLGRIWERDRENLAAQKKVESLLSSLNLQEQSAESIQSLKELFEKLSPSMPQVVSRQKFVQLYYDFPGQWARNLIPAYDLIEIDADKNWQRVLLTQFGPWVTVSFINNQNFPIREIFLSADQLVEIQHTRTVQRGQLEDLGFRKETIFPLGEFLKLFKTLDPVTQRALFPDPQWFLRHNYHITRMGLLEQSVVNGTVQPPLFGIEYETEFFTDVLLTPIPNEVTNNLLSQFERPGAGSAVTPETFLQDF